MVDKELDFVIPTHRLRDVSETVEAYDENFWRNGHAAKIIVFDDSSVANHEKYFPLLEKTVTENELYYVGPKEKEEFIRLICKRLRDKKLDSLVRNLFRPSYGGNRNFTLMYTLGQLMVSADDDMRPYGLIEDSPESLAEGEISRGKLLRATQNGYTRKSFDVLSSFRDALGKTVSELPENYERGELLKDTSMDLETNTTHGLARENSLLLQKGRLTKNSVVKIAQTFRSGTNDHDAIDYVDMYLDDEGRTNIEELNDQYVLVNFRPAITNKNWRMDCGVGGYDNTLGLPPFFPTRLRFEDYIYRLWIQQPGIISAHVDSAQNHLKNNYMRNPMAAEVFNEEICSLLKRKIKSSVTRLDALSIEFGYEGEVTAKDSEEVLEKVSALRNRVLKAAAATTIGDRQQSLLMFATNLEKAFYGFEPDFFQQNVTRMVDDIINMIKSSLELWPTLVEIVYFHKNCQPLPRVRGKTNPKKKDRSDDRVETRNARLAAH
jgi:hypothetical protein